MIIPYIYGNPNGFKLYNGTEKEYDFFLSFYDDTVRSSRVTICRNVNGKTYYNYLQYGVRECSTYRSDGLFGMSLAVDDNCYSDKFNIIIQRLDALCETIINRRVIIERDDMGILHFLINDFSDKKSELEWIKKEMVNIISTDDIKRYDESFLFEKKGRALIDINTTNEKVMQVFRMYKSVALVNSYKITYIVDGEVVHIDNAKVGANLSNKEKPNPTKVGYTFSGWTGMPEIMPDNDIVIKGSYKKIEHNPIETRHFDIKEKPTTPTKEISNKKSTNDSLLPAKTFKIIVITIAVIILIILIVLGIKDYRHRYHSNGNNTEPTKAESTITESTALTNDKDSMLTEFQTFMKNNDISNAYVVHKGKLEGKILKDTLLSQLTRIINKREEKKCDIFFEKYKNYLNDKDILCVPPNEKIDNIKNLCKLIIKHKLIVNSDILYAMFYNADFFYAVMKDYKGKTK